MIKQITKIKVYLQGKGFIAGTALVFLLALVIHLNLIIPAFLLCLYVYVRRNKLPFKNINLSGLVLLYLVIFVAAYYTLSRGWSLWGFPFLSLPILASLLFNQPEVSFLLTLAAAISLVALSPLYFAAGLIFLLGGIIVIILVQGARRRTTIIRSGLVVGMAQAGLLIFTEHLQLAAPQRYLMLVLNGIVSSIIALGCLPIFEYLFRTVTNISLLELADFHHPLLQRMIMEAPGTYHHSLIVGNLSESAAQAVGANALLARIGAYYHDIGKLSKPWYFSENQELPQSKHDALTPTMSKMIIMNHVKEGVELAKKYKLSPPLLDFILEHHGKSLVYYFYRRALEGLEEDHEVKEEGFRYPGPKPRSKETAIVLLADSVEAATRALKDPQPAKITELVHKVINNKFIDRQLDDCDLTLGDLEKISAVFIRILSGIYHSRISYPQERNGSPR
jgi:putative nucleotidyltransferase with HDIG domain